MTESGTGIKWAALSTTIASTVLVTLSGVWITAIESAIGFQIYLINGLGSFVGALVSEALGQSAGLVVASWRAAAVQAVEAGPLAPILLALEAVVILTLAFAIWERRPYA
ncbi:hypothetical protein [Haloplanus rubicundus]|uniref:hypothetical protein n=1 Tax=Haloplanus rubicundus TaxID=1547898 RepID=UPI0013007543|nr:hypothetical protein [Haloplanus rubicundus]